MQVVKPVEGGQDWANVTIVAPDDQTDAGDSETAKILTGLERSFALDTAALLGGNEYLIKQMLTEIENLEYNEKELEVLKWGLTELWGAEVTEKVIASTVAAKRSEADANLTKGFRNQECLNKLFTKENTPRLPHTLSQCLLYCGRYDDTKIYTNPLDSMQRFFLINLNNYAYMNLPIGHIPDGNKEGGKSRGKPCEKLAVIYFKLANEAPSPSSFGERKPSAATLATHDLKDINERRRYLAPNKPRERQLSESQKLSESLALEKGMLSKLHFVGIVPVP